jgi:hypothetical protein
LVVGKANNQTNPSIPIPKFHKRETDPTRNTTKQQTNNSSTSIPFHSTRERDRQTYTHTHTKRRREDGGSGGHGRGAGAQSHGTMGLIS